MPGDRRMQHKCALDFGRTHPVARHVDHIVNTTGHPVIAVLVAGRAVTGEVKALVRVEVGLFESLMVAVDSPHLPRPRGLQCKHSCHTITFELFTGLGVENCGLYSEERHSRRARLGRDGSGKRGDENPAGFRLPPRIDDRAAFLADLLVGPAPRFRVDRLADRSQQLQ